MNATHDVAADVKKLSLELLTLLLFCLAVLLRLLPSLAELDSRYLGGADQDAGLYIWLVRSFASDWASALRLDSSAFYPYGFSRAWSDNFLLPSALFCGFRQVGFSEALAYNFVILLAVTLNGYGVYVLARSMALSYSASFAAGLLFQGNAYLWANLGHPQLQFAFYIPFALAFASRALRSNGSFWWLLVGLTISCAFLTTVYYAIFCYLAVFVVGVLSLVMERRRWTPTRLLTSAFVALIGLLPIFPFVTGYQEVRETFDTRHLYEAYYFSASALSYVTFSSLNRLWDGTSTWNSPEGQLGGSIAQLAAIAIGFLVCTWKSSYRRLRLVASVIVFATCLLTCNPITGVADRYAAACGTWLIAGLFIWKLWSLREKERPESADVRFSFLLVSVGTLFFLLSLGPLGNPAKDEMAFSVYVPFYFLAPGVDSLRAVARYGLVVWMCVAIGAPMFLERILTRNWLRRTALTALVVGSIGEGIPGAIPLEAMPDAPSVLEDLHRAAGEESATLFLPLADDVTREGVKSWGEFARYNTRYMNWSVDTVGRIVNGYSGQRSKLILELPVALRDFPSRTSLDRLATIAGLRFIVVVPSLWTTRSSAELETKISEFPDRLSLVAKDGEGNLLLEFRPHSTPPYFLVPSDCSLQLTWEGLMPGDCLPKWSNSLTANPTDIEQSLVGGSSRLPASGVIERSGAKQSVRPRIVGFQGGCTPPLKTTSVCK